MKKIATVGEFYIYKLEPDEEVEKGLKYGIIERGRADREENLDSVDMDFYKENREAAIRTAEKW